MNTASGWCRVSFCLFHVLLVGPIHASRCPSGGWAEPVCRAKSNQLRRYFFYSCKTWQCRNLSKQFLGGARMVWPRGEARENASRPTIFAAAWRTRSHHSGDNGNGSKRELPSWNAHCKLGISGGGAITVPLPRLPVIPKDISVCFHDSSSLTTRGMLKIHLQGVGRRHHSFSAQAVVPLVIGYHYLYFHMHPSLAIMIPPSQRDTRRGARGTRTAHRATPRNCSTTVGWAAPVS